MNKYLVTMGDETSFTVRAESENDAREKMVQTAIDSTTDISDVKLIVEEKKSKKTSIYLTDEIRALLRCPPRGPSEAIGIIAERYAALLAPEKKRLSILFTESELNAMRNACNGTAWTPWSIRGGVHHNIIDSLDEELTMFGVVREELEKKLRALSPVQEFALVELIEEWWEK